MQNMPAKSQVPSHHAEFIIATADYPDLLSEIDNTVASFQLKRLGAAPGLDELKGREVLYAIYKTDINEWRAALSITDVKSPGKLLVRVYGDYFEDPEQRNQFVADITAIIQRYGGTFTEMPE